MGMKNMSNLMETHLEFLRKLGKGALRNNRIFVPLNAAYQGRLKKDLFDI